MHPAHPADWLWWHQFGVESQKWTNMRSWDKKTSLPHACHHCPSGCILHCGSACGWNAGFKLLRWLGKSGESLWIMLTPLNVSKQTTGWGDNVVVARITFRDNISLSDFFAGVAGRHVRCRTVKPASGLRLSLGIKSTSRLGKIWFWLNVNKKNLPPLVSADLP